MTPPLHVPDEQAHLYRAYLVSEGRLDLLPAPRLHSRPLPRSLFDLADAALGEVRFRPENRFPPGAHGRLARIPLAAEDRVPVHFPQTLQYTFLPYAVPGVAILAGRLAGAEPLALLYLARAANLLFGTLAAVTALRLLPAMRWWLAALALAPMAVALRASASADVLAMSAAWITVAAAWRLATAGEGRARPALLALASGAAAVLGAARPPFAPLALLPLLAPARRLPAASPWPWRLGHLALVGAATAWGFLTAMRVGFTREGTGIDPPAQLRFALAHPAAAVEAVLADLADHGGRYLEELVGKLGWLDTPLPGALVVAYLLVLAALVVAGGEPGLAVPLGQRLAAGGAFAATVLAIGASQYLVWTPVGASRIPDGIQGRYFLPAALALAWAVHRAPRGEGGWRRALPWALGAFVALVAAVTLRVVWRRYYG